MVFTILDSVSGGTIHSLDCVKNRPFMNLINWDVVKVWVIIEKDRKEIDLNCVNPGSDDEIVVHPAYNYEKGRLYTPYTYIYDAKDSVTLNNCMCVFVFVSRFCFVFFLLNYHNYYYYYSLFIIHYCLNCI